MKSIAQLPENVRSAIAAHEDAVLWAWLEQQQAAAVLAEAGADALLVRIGQGFDFAPLAQACAGYHVYAGQRGQAPQHRIACLCRALVVKWLNGWSYERTVRQVRENNLVRWFVGLRWQEACFSVATLWRFEQWVKRHQPRLFFETVLMQIEADFPAEGRAAQNGDTFALQSRAAEQSRSELVRGTAKRLLKALARVDEARAEQVDAAFGAAGRLALFGAADEAREHWLKKEERDARETATALAARRLLAVVQAVVAPLPPSQQVERRALHRWLALLDKVLADEFVYYFMTSTLRRFDYIATALSGILPSQSATPKTTWREHHGSSMAGGPLAAPPIAPAAAWVDESTTR